MNGYDSKLLQIQNETDALHSCLISWRMSLGRQEWAPFGGYWRRVTGYGLGEEEMSESEMCFYDTIYETLEFLKQEKENILEMYLEEVKS